MEFGRVIVVALVLAGLNGGVLASISCFFCDHLVQKLHKEVEGNSSLSVFIDILEDACFILHVEKKEVCKGLVQEFAPVVRGVFQKGTLDTPSLCSMLVKSDCGKSLAQNWTVTVPGGKPEYEPPQLPKPGSPVVRAIHLADPHIDRFYAEGANVDCGEPLCCRPWQGKGDSGRWGNVNCDPPASLLDNLFQHISETQPVNYVIWTGDIPAHDIWNQSRDAQIGVIKTISAMLRKYMPHADIYPAVGNHEASPVNIFAPPTEAGPLSDQWLLDTLADTWEGWLPDDALRTVRLGGYYVVRRPDGLRVVSLNFNYCNNLNLWLYVNDTDPSGQLHWLIGQLLEAEAAGDKVHLIGHIPPGIKDCLPAWSAAYNKIISRFANTVVAQFFGHTHFDEFEVFFDSSGGGGGGGDVAPSVPNNIAYIAPSVTTYKGHFPTYRVYDLDGGYPNCSWSVLDHHNYMVNLTEANLSGTPNWTLEYSARSAYNMPSLFPRDWADFAVRCAKDVALLNQYLDYRMHGPTPQACHTDECREEQICRMLTSASGNSEHCMPVRV